MASVAALKKLRAFVDIRPAVPWLVVSTLFINLLSLALPMVLLQVYDRIIPNSSTGTLLLLVLGVGTAIVLETLLRLARSGLTGWVGARFEHHAGVNGIRHILRTPLHVLDREGTGIHLERMSALPAIKEHYADSGITVLMDLPFVLLFLGFIFALAGPLVVVPIVLLAVFALLMWREAGRLRTAIGDYNTVRDRRLNFNIEVLNGIHAVKSMAMEGLMRQRYARLQESVAEANHRVVRHNTSALSLSGLFSQLAMVLVVAAGSTLVIGGGLTVGGLAACTLLTGRAMQPVQRAVAAWTRLQGLRLSEDRAAEIFDLPTRAAAETPHKAEVEGALELRGVACRYDGTDEDLLHDIDLKLAPRESVGISGLNGCGKSTLLALMRGAIQPTEGTVLLDGVPIWQWDRDCLARNGVGYLPSEAELFRGTLLDNLTMYRKELREPALEAARALGLDQVVATMPQGYATRIADGASDALPRGIRQRIAIARVLALKPRVILFDEANTAMDSKGDESLRLALEKLQGEATLVIVSLRPSLLRMVDRRYEIQGGTLVERKDPSLHGRSGPSTASADTDARGRA